MTTDRFKSRPGPGTRVELPSAGGLTTTGHVLGSGSQPSDPQRVRVEWDDGLRTTVRCEQLRPEASLSREDAGLDAEPPRLTEFDWANGPSDENDRDAITRWAFDKGVEWGKWRAAARARAKTIPAHCPSCDGYHSAVMDDGQRSVGVCEGVEARVVETAEELDALWSDVTVLRASNGTVFGPCHGFEYEGWWQSIGESPGNAWKSAPLLEDFGPVTVLNAPVPPTPEEADSEEVRRLSAKIIAREKPILDRLAEHDGPEEGDRG